MRYLNLACGNIYIKSNNWENCDFAPESKHVRRVNLLKKFPYNDNLFDLVYSSHYIEHVPKLSIDFFLSECIRVLVPGGLLRLVLPDFESITREYLKNIDTGSFKNAEFNIVEMVDQCVRTKPGGELNDWYRMAGNDEQLRNYISTRTGKDFSKKIDLNVNKLTRWKKFTFPKFKQYLEQKMVFALINLFPAWFKTFHVSKTSTGEKHLWIYDFHLLSKMLYSIGFRDIVKLTATESTDQGFPIYPLDIDQEGKSRKGSESMYIEARKPEYF